MSTNKQSFEAFERVVALAQAAVFHGLADDDDLAALDLARAVLERVAQADAEKQAYATLAEKGVFPLVTLYWESLEARMELENETRADAGLDPFPMPTSEQVSEILKGCSFDHHAVDALVEEALEKLMEELC